MAVKMKVRKMSAATCEADSGRMTRRISLREYLKSPHALTRRLKDSKTRSKKLCVLVAWWLCVGWFRFALSDDENVNASPSARVRSAPPQKAMGAGRKNAKRLANQTCATAPRVRPTPKTSRRGRWKAEEARSRPPRVQARSQRRKRSLSMG